MLLKTTGKPKARTSGRLPGPVDGAQSPENELPVQLTIPPPSLLDECADTGPTNLAPFALAPAKHEGHEARKQNRPKRPTRIAAAGSLESQPNGEQHLSGDAADLGNDEDSLPPPLSIGARRSPYATLPRQPKQLVPVRSTSPKPLSERIEEGNASGPTHPFAQPNSKAVTANMPISPPRVVVSIATQTTMSSAATSTSTQTIPASAAINCDKGVQCDLGPIKAEKDVLPPYVPPADLRSAYHQQSPPAKRQAEELKQSSRGGWCCPLFFCCGKPDDVPASPKRTERAPLLKNAA